MESNFLGRKEVLDWGVSWRTERRSAEMTIWAPLTPLSIAWALLSSLFQAKTLRGCACRDLYYTGSALARRLIKLCGSEGGREGKKNSHN